jgi:hypothetical protein
MEPPFKYVGLNRPLPKSLFAWSKPFLINLGIAPGDVKTRPLGFNQLTSLTFALPRFSIKNVLMTAQMDSPLGKGLLTDQTH